SPKPEQLELRHEKHNLTAPAEPLLLEVAEHGVIRPMSEARRMALDSADTDTVLDAFAKVSTDVPTASSGPRTAWHVLEAHLPEKWKPDRLRDALIALERAGRIRREKYRTPSRHLSERWVVSDHVEAMGDSDAQD